MSAPINPLLAELEFFISLLGKTPTTRSLSATKQKLVLSLEQKGVVQSRLPEVYPSPDEFVFLTDKGKEVLQNIADHYSNEAFL